jgi:hypothetical protein
VRVPELDAAIATTRLLWNGHQARAFIAGMWSSNLCSHWLRPANGTEDAIDTSQMWRRLSLPPLANCCPRPKPLELAHLLSVSLVRLHDMIPDSHIIVHDLAVHAAGRQDVVVPCRRANSCLMRVLNCRENDTLRRLIQEWCVERIPTLNKDHILVVQGPCCSRYAGSELSPGGPIRT